MKVKIKGEEIELCYSMRLHIIYENITGESVDFTNLTSIKTLTTLLLATIMASAQKNKIELNLTYDEYCDWLDENDGYVVINEFANWLAETIQAKYAMLADNEEENKGDDLPPKKRKKMKG